MEQLTMCVMDDIQAVVKGIASTIPWEEHEVQIVGTANNGEQGWSLLVEQQPDIVITDIKMPRLSGLELMKRAMDAGLRSKFILLADTRFSIRSGSDQARSLRLSAQTVYA